MACDPNLPKLGCCEVTEPPPFDIQGLTLAVPRDFVHRFDCPLTAPAFGRGYTVRQVQVTVTTLTSPFYGTASQTETITWNVYNATCGKVTDITYSPNQATLTQIARDIFPLTVVSDVIQPWHRETTYSGRNGGSGVAIVDVHGEVVNMSEFVAKFGAAFLSSPYGTTSEASGVNANCDGSLTAPFNSEFFPPALMSHTAAPGEGTLFTLGKVRFNRLPVGVDLCIILNSGTPGAQTQLSCTRYPNSALPVEILPPLSLAGNYDFDQCYNGSVGVGWTFYRSDFPMPPCCG